MTNIKWRENIHKLLKSFFSDWEQEIPIVVIDAIDSAYLQGLEEREIDKEFDEQWEKELPKFVGHGTGIMADVRPFFKEFLHSQLDKARKEGFKKGVEAMKLEKKYGLGDPWLDGYDQAIEDLEELKKERKEWL